MLEKKGQQVKSSRENPFTLAKRKHKISLQNFELRKKLTDK